MEYTLNNFCFIYNNEKSVFKRILLFLKFYYYRRSHLKQTKFFNFIKVSPSKSASPKFEVHIRREFKYNYIRKNEILNDILKFVISFKSLEFIFDAYNIGELLEYYIENLDKNNLKIILDVKNKNSLYVNYRVKFDSKYSLAIKILRIFRHDWLDYSKISGWKTYSIRVKNFNYVR